MVRHLTRVVLAAGALALVATSGAPMLLVPRQATVASGEVAVPIVASAGPAPSKSRGLATRIGAREETRAIAQRGLGTSGLEVDAERTQRDAADARAPRQKGDAPEIVAVGWGTDELSVHVDVRAPRSDQPLSLWRLDAARGPRELARGRSDDAGWARFAGVSLPEDGGELVVAPTGPTPFGGGAPWVGGARALLPPEVLCLRAASAGRQAFAEIRAPSSGYALEWLDARGALQLTSASGAARRVNRAQLPVRVRTRSRSGRHSAPISVTSESCAVASSVESGSTIASEGGTG